MPSHYLIVTKCITVPTRRHFYLTHSAHTQGERYKSQLPNFGPEVDAELTRYIKAIEQFARPEHTVVWSYRSPRASLFAHHSGIVLLLTLWFFLSQLRVLPRTGCVRHSRDHRTDLQVRTSSTDIGLDHPVRSQCPKPTSVAKTWKLDAGHPDRGILRPPAHKVRAIPWPVVPAHSFGVLPVHLY